eukprot:12733012-Alexandrium_andersonii.AAC.1
MTETEPPSPQPPEAARAPGTPVSAYLHPTAASAPGARRSLRRGRTSPGSGAGLRSARGASS